MKRLLNKKVYFLSAVLSLLLCGCGAEKQYVPELLEPVNAGTSWSRVERGDITDVKIYNGYIEPDVTECMFETNGKIKELNVELGDSVSAGQVIATLNAADVADQITACQNAITDAMAEYALTKREIELSLKSGEKELEKLQLKHDTRGISIKEIQMQKQQLNLQYQGIKTELLVAEQNRKIADYGAEQGNINLTAPISGTVVSTGGYLPGDEVTKNSVIAYIENPETRHIVTSAGEENDFLNVKYLYTLLDGKEIPLSFLPHTSREIRLAKAEGYKLVYHFQTTASLAGQSYGTYVPIMTAQVALRNALTVPSGAIYQEDETYYVYRNQEGERQYQAVTIGTQKSGKTEILSGLQEGDEVYVKE